MWRLHKLLGKDVFDQALKCPPFFSWAVEQIGKDDDDRSKLILDVMDALQPWLNFNLFSAIEQEKQKQNKKISEIAQTSTENVDVVNMYDVMMKRAGVLKPKTK